LAGSPIAVAQGVHSFLDTATMSSANGILVYKRASRDAQLTWFDRTGKVVGRVAEPGLYAGLSLSPDGTRATVVRTNPQVTSDAAMWLIDLASGASTRFAAQVGPQAGVWSRDGSRITFVSNRSGFENDLMQRSTRGADQEDLLIRVPDRAAASSWSADGRFLVYVVVDPRTNSDLWALPAENGSKPFVFLRTGAIESQAQFSPDRLQAPRLVSLTSNESGRDEIELRTFPDGGNRMVLSNGGGHSSRWRGDGKELFYVAPDGMVMSVAISGSPVRAQPATPLFRAPQGFVTMDATGRRGPAPWDVTPDGQRFLFAAPLEGGTASQFTVALNWQQGLAEK
jgi:eukaryotic-like serine/threonine-protein kinase